MTDFLILPQTALIPSLDIDEAIQATRIARRGEDGLYGPAVPVNPLARLIASDEFDQAILPSPKSAKARMHARRVVELRRHFDRQHLEIAVREVQFVA